MASGAGTLTAALSFTKSATMTLQVLDAAETVVAQVTGPTRLTVGVPVPAGSHIVRVAGSTTASFSLSVTHPSP